MKKSLWVFCGLAFAFAAVYLSLASTPASAPESLPALSTELKLVIPPDARLLAVHRENGMDDLIAVKLEMKEEDVGPFLRGTPISPESLVSGDAEGNLGPDDGAWDPSKAIELRTGHTWLEAESRALHVGVSNGRKGKVFVYLVNHGT